MTRTQQRSHQLDKWGPRATPGRGHYYIETTEGGPDIVEMRLESVMNTGEDVSKV